MSTLSERMPRGPKRAPGRFEVPMSKGTPTTATSSCSGALHPGRRMKVVIPANRGSSFPPIGCGYADVVIAARYRVGNMAHSPRIPYHGTLFNALLIARTQGRAAGLRSRVARHPASEGKPPPGERVGRLVPQSGRDAFYDGRMTVTSPIGTFPSGTVEFTRMADGTREEYQYLHGLEREYISELPGRLVSALRLLDSGLGGYKISRYQHSLQTATRAMR